MDRDTILSSFQEISQIQNFEECIQILESVNWDLQSAVDSMDQVISTPRLESRMELDFMSFSPMIESRHIQNRELKFNVDIKGRIVTVNIMEQKTVGDLIRLIASEINEPNTRLKINGLKNPYNDYTVLQSMRLPLISDVVANIIEPNNFISVGSSSNEIPQQMYHLSIEIYMNGKYSQTLPLSFYGKDSIGKVKFNLSNITGTDENEQQWIGWPNDTCSHDQSLAESGLPENSSLIVYITVNDKSSRQNIGINSPSAEVSLNNSRENDNEDDDYPEDDFTDDIELAETETEISKKRSAALMDVNAYLDPVSAVIKFSSEFSARYSPSTPCTFTSTSKSASTLPCQMTPPFFMGSIDDAISSTLNLMPHERKPLFLYLHHGESIQANIFCTQILCYSEVCLFFVQSDYTIWPWDVTYSDNKAKLMNWMVRNFGVNVSSPLRIISKDQYPVIVVLSKSQGTIEVLEIIDGMRTKEETVSHLWDIKTKFEEKLIPDIRAWDERQLRDLVKQEQDAAYHESLLQDQQKEQIKKDENERAKNAQDKAKREKEKVLNERERRISGAAKKLPKEPEEGPDTVTIQLRAPPSISVSESPSSMMTRRFLFSHSLVHLVAYMESLGFLRAEFKLLTAYPRKDLMEMADHRVTLKELGITKRETLTLERI